MQSFHEAKLHNENHCKQFYSLLTHFRKWKCLAWSFYLRTFTKKKKLWRMERNENRKSENRNKVSVGIHSARERKQNIFCFAGKKNFLFSTQQRTLQIGNLEKLRFATGKLESFPFDRWKKHASFDRNFNPETYLNWNETHV